MSIVRFFMKQAWKAIGKADAKRIARQPAIQDTNFESGIPYIEGINPLQQLNLYYPYGYDMDRDGLLPVTRFPELKKMM